MPKCVRLSSAVSGPECPATQSTLPTFSSQSCASWLNRRIMPYLQIRERAVGRAGAPEAVELLLRVRGEVDRRHAGHDAGVGELGDLLRQQRAFVRAVALVPAVAREVAVACGEAADVGRVGQVGRGGDEERPAVLLRAEGVDPRAPLGQRGAVGDRRARLGVQVRRVVGEVEQPLVLPRDCPSLARRKPGISSGTLSPSATSRSAR